MCFNIHAVKMCVLSFIIFMVKLYRHHADHNSLLGKINFCYIYLSLEYLHLQYIGLCTWHFFLDCSDDIYVFAISDACHFRGEWKFTNPFYELKVALRLKPIWVFLVDFKHEEDFNSSTKCVWSDFQIYVGITSI